MATGQPTDADAEPASVAGTPLFDRFLERIGIDRLVTANSSSRDWSPLVGYALLVAFVEVVALQAYNLWVGRGVVFAANPLWLVRPLLLVGAAVATQLLHERYDRAVARSNLRARAADPERFEGLVPDWLLGGIIAVGVAFTVLNAVVILTIPQIYAAGGPARVVRFLVVTPVGYVPVFGSFLATYISVEMLLPRTLSKSDVGLDFLDPERLGGMRPIGELVKFAYYLLMVGLVGQAVATYGPYLLEGVFAYEALEPPGAAINAAFTAVWAAAVLTMAYGIYTLHHYMVREKQEALHRLDTRAREHIDDPWDITRVDVSDPPGEYEAYRSRVEHVTSTREYPATFTMWSQLAVGVMIPKAIQFVLAAA
ncbi:MAG: hypothetical protein ABEI80_02020 [Haloplanus sp.]